MYFSTFNSLFSSGWRLCNRARVKKLLFNSICEQNLNRTYAAASNLKFVRDAGYTQHENQFAHGVMHEHPNYHLTIFRENFLKSNESDLIHRLSQSKTLDENSAKELTEICTSVKEKLKTLTDKELLAAFDAMSIWPDEFTRKDVFIQTCDQLDLECQSRLSTWTTDEALLFADMWYRMRLSKKSDYIWSCLKKFCRKIKHLSNSQVVQVMFLVNLCRKIPSVVPQFDVEYYLSEVLPDLSLEELAIVGMAFFKSETKMQNRKMMDAILDKLLKHSHECSDFVLSILCKNIRYSMQPTCSEKLYALQDKLVKEVPRLKLITLTHIALLGTNILQNHTELMNAIIQKYSDNISEARLKDLERIVFTIYLFDMRKEDFIQRAISHLNNISDDIKHYPRPYVSFVSYLTSLQIYPVDHINNVMEPKFIESVLFTGKSIGHEFLSIDVNVELECPNYQGNRMNPKLRRNFTRSTNFKPSLKVTSTQKMAYEVEDILRLMFGKEKIYFSQFLPSFVHNDFLIGFNTKGESLILPEDWKQEHKWGVVKRPPDEINSWLCLLVGGWNTLIRNTNEPLGSTAVKMRQLQLLGYKTALIPYYEWRFQKEEGRVQIINYAIAKTGVINAK